MQLKNVVTDTEEKTLENVSYTINPVNFTNLDTVVVCDNNIRAGNWRRQGYPCIGVETKEPVISVKYVTDSLKAIDDEYIRLVYCRYHNIPMKIFETKNFIVREITTDDVKALYDIYKGRVLEFVEPLYEYDEEIEFTKSYIRNMYDFYGYGLWVLERKCDGKIIGRAGLSNRLVNDENEIELGYIIGEEYQRQGYAFEVCKKILEYGFEHLGAERIITCIDKENVPSLRLAHKLGFNEAADDTDSDLSILCKLRN